MADLASFSLSDRRAAPHSRAHQYRLTAVSAVIQSAARLERGRTLNNVRGREGGRGGECNVTGFYAIDLYMVCVMRRCERDCYGKQISHSTEHMRWFKRPRLQQSKCM